MNMRTTTTKKDMQPSELIAEQISKLTDWRGEMMAHLRRIILEADPDISEEWKWGTPVWSHNGMVCSAAAFKDHVKLNFFNGAAIRDSKGLFNGGQEAKNSRSIDFSRGTEINETALMDFIQAAVSYNSRGDKTK